MVKIFGFEITTKKRYREIPSIVPPNLKRDDSTIAEVAVNAGGYFGNVVDLDGVIKTENDLLKKYRTISQYSDCEFAIDEIVNEVIVTNETSKCVEINVDEVKVSDTVKNAIREEFQNIKDLLKFEDTGHEIFRQWYVDGRIYYHILIDKEKVKEGIQELRQIDPRKIKRVKKIHKKKDEQGVEVITHIEEYFVFNNKGISESNLIGEVISLDSMVHCPSGIVDTANGMTLSHLHKAIKPVNNLKITEDSLVIYRISRAPERRIFYIDVGTLPKQKAEQYVEYMMAQYRNKITYDSSTGNVRDDKRHLSIMDDFWIPRREGGKGTEITTLPGAENLGKIEDIEYFQGKLFRSLNVPIGRLQPEQGFSLGRSTEITRDEIKFNKFIIRLRRKFSDMFSQALRVQLIAKEIINPDEWDDIYNRIRYDYIEDNHFSEMKEQEILLNRIQNLQQYDPFIGRLYSKRWIYEHILMMNEKEIKKMEDEIRQENAEQAKIEAEEQAQQQAAYLDMQKKVGPDGEMPDMSANKGAPPAETRARPPAPAEPAKLKKTAKLQGGQKGNKE